MSDTPETDAVQHEGLLKTNAIPMKVVTAEFARNLERERNSVIGKLQETQKDALDRVIRHADRFKKVCSERNEWREIAEELCDAAAYGLAQWDDGYSLKVCKQIGDAILRFRQMKKEEEA